MLIPVLNQALGSHLSALGVEMIGCIEEVFVGQADFIERGKYRDRGALLKCPEEVCHRGFPCIFTIGPAAGRRFEIDLGTLLARHSMKTFKKEEDFFLNDGDGIGLKGDFPSGCRNLLKMPDKITVRIVSSTDENIAHFLQGTSK